MIQYDGSRLLMRNQFSPWPALPKKSSCRHGDSSLCQSVYVIRVLSCLNSPTFLSPVCVCVCVCVYVCVCVFTCVCFIDHCFGLLAVRPPDPSLTSHSICSAAVATHIRETVGRRSSWRRYISSAANRMRRGQN